MPYAGRIRSLGNANRPPGIEYVEDVRAFEAEIEGGIVTLPAEGRSGSRLVIDLSGAWLSAGAGVGWSF